MPDDLEFSISQYVDGTLADEQRAALEALLAGDRDAQALLAEHQAVTQMLRAAPLPEVQWDRLAEVIGAAIDEAPSAASQKSWWAGRKVTAGLALAASVLLAIGIAIHLWLSQNNGGRPDGNPVKVVASSGILTVQGPAADRPEGPTVTEISIGPGGEYARESTLAPYADEIDSRPSRVIIASGVNPQSAAPIFPY